MRPFTKPLALWVSLAAPCLAVAAAPRGQISLLQTLSGWTYPGAKLQAGASMSDGGDPSVQSVKCQAILTTPDPVAKVVAYYEEKLRPGEPADAKSARSLSVQDDSGGRPMGLRVLVVNRAETSTTLVISRAEGEEETHIAWSHFLRLGGGR